MTCRAFSATKLGNRRPGYPFDEAAHRAQALAAITSEDAAGVKVVVMVFTPIGPDELPASRPRDQAQADSGRAQAMLESSGQQTITPAIVREFARTARERIRIDGGGYRRDHLRALAQRVEMADGEVRIMGSKGDLLRTPGRRLGHKTGYRRSAHFCSELAEGEKLKSNVLSQKFDELRADSIGWKLARELARASGCDFSWAAA